MSRHILLGTSANSTPRGRELVLMVELRGSAGLPRMAAIGASRPLPQVGFSSGNPVLWRAVIQIPIGVLLESRRVQLTPVCRNEASASRFNVQTRFEHCASAIVSSADTSNMHRPGAIGHAAVT